MKISCLSQVKMGAFLSYLSIAINIIAGLIYTPWMIDMIGKSAYGLYTLANSLITLFLVDWGFSAATSRYLSKYRVENDKESAEKFLGAIYKVYIIADIALVVIFVVIYFLLEKIFTSLTPIELEQFKGVYVISVLFNIVNFPFVTFNGIFTAYEKFVALKLIDIAHRVFSIIVTVIALLLGGGLYALVTIHVVIGLLVLILKYVVIRFSIDIKARFTGNQRAMYREIFTFSLWVTVSILARRLVFNITPSILGITTDSSAIAIFGIVSVIEGYVFTITTAINGMLMPKVSRVVVNDKSRSELSKLSLVVGKYQYIVNGLIVTGFIIVGQTFINLWMGEDFASAYWGILLVIVPGLFFNALQISDVLFEVLNKVKIKAFVDVATGVTNVVLSFVLSKHYGMIGACISICISYTLRGLLMNVLSYKVLRLDMVSFVKQCYIRMSVPIIIVVLLGTVINHFLVIESWMSLIIKSLLVVVGYATCIWYIGIDRSERKYIINRNKGE